MTRRGNKVYKTPKGTHVYYVCATVKGKRERHSHYLTKPEAIKFSELFKTPSAKKMGAKQVTVNKYRPRQRSEC